MSVQLITSPSASQVKMQPVKSKDLEKKSENFGHDGTHDAPKKVKAGVLLTTLVGVAAAMALTFKSKKMPMNSLKDYFKNFVKVTYDEEKEEVPKLVLKLAAGSVGGGLVGGAIFDKKENLKAKLREAVIQVVGNIATPLACVWGGMKLYKGKIKPHVNLPGKLKELPGIAMSAVCLVTGIILGNKIGNYTNKKVFKCDEKRTLKLADMSPHIDDLATATTFIVPPESIIGKLFTRVIPAALMIAGYSTGTAQEKPEMLNKAIQQ